MGKPGRVLIFGAGAIGRGYLGPLLARQGFELHFVDVAPGLVEQLRGRSSYLATIIGAQGYERLEVPLGGAHLLSEAPDAADFDLVFCCVGPNNCFDLAERFKSARAVICCENDSSLVLRLRELSGNERIYFGIPDVITSNTAPAELLREDPLMTVSERGHLVLEAGDYDLPAEISQVNAEELHMHWMCKFFIHNAPHAVTAYLGWLRRCVYIHEAMADPDIARVVTGSIQEISAGVVRAGYATQEFASMYMHKELGRFRNPLLFDPIRRVARQPIRKLDKDNRLVLGLRLALFDGPLPEYTATGVKAALEYDEPQDEEAVYLNTLRQSIGDREVLRQVAGIPAFDPLGQYIIDRDISTFL